jgi:hypothetical protein
MSDMINPDHYKVGGIETIDVIKAKLGDNYKFYVKGNLMKYSERLGNKDAWSQELRKIAWYALDLADELDKKKSSPVMPTEWVEDPLHDED